MLVMASYSRLRLCAAHIAVRSIRARNVTIEAIAEAVAEDCSYSLWEASALAVEDSVAVASAALFCSYRRAERSCQVFMRFSSTDRRMWVMPR